MVIQQIYLLLTVTFKAVPQRKSNMLFMSVCFVLHVIIQQMMLCHLMRALRLLLRLKACQKCPRLTMGVSPPAAAVGNINFK